MAFTTYVNMQMLGYALRLDCHQTEGKQWGMLARHLGALRGAVKKLEKLYKGETPPTRMQVQIGLNGPIFFPAYSCFDSISEGEKRVQYLTQPFEKKLVFHGKCDSDEVLIKFVKRYSVEVHEYCAGKNLAPRMLGSRLLPGEWMMVVMERLDESYKMVRDYGKTTELHEEIERSIRELHQAHYVHGDVRDVNIMVRKENEGYSIKLVDLDWAGRIGMVRYPRNVGNSESLRRPEGVYDDELIKAEDDMAMLDYIFRGVVLPRGHNWWDTKKCAD
jgi:serine/threonine protein kinase